MKLNFLATMFAIISLGLAFMVNSLYRENVAMQHRLEQQQRMMTFRRQAARAFSECLDTGIQAQPAK